MNLDVILFVVFILTVAALVFFDRKKIQFQGIVMMRRTKKGRDFIDNTAKRHPKFWNALATAGVIISIPALVIGTLFLLNNAIAITKGEVKEGVRFVLPYPTGEANTQTPGLLLLPWWIWVIGIATVVIPHEMMHGVVCRLEHVRIKSLGWLLLIIIPGAFVEPDENQLKKMPRKTKMKVYAAGSFANFFVAGIFFILVVSMTNLFFTPYGAIPSGIVPESPAYYSNLSGAIVSINSKEISSMYDIYYSLSNVSIGSEIVVHTAEADLKALPTCFIERDALLKSYEITTTKHPELNISFLGITKPYKSCLRANESVKDYAPFLEGTLVLFFWIFVLNFGIGIVNLLPIKPLDGGLLFEEIAGRFSKRSAQITKIVSLLVLGLLLFNLFGPLIV